MTTKRIPAAQLSKIKQVMPLMLDKIKRGGNILPLSQLIPLYGEHTIQHAVDAKLITILICTRRDTTNKEPNRQIKVAHLPEWNGDKPAWFV